DAHDPAVDRALMLAEESLERGEVAGREAREGGVGHPKYVTAPRQGRFRRPVHLPPHPAYYRSEKETHQRCAESSSPSSSPSPGRRTRRSPCRPRRRRARPPPPSSPKS